MSTTRTIGAFLVGLLASNLAFLVALFVPPLFGEIWCTSLPELLSGVMFVSLFSLPIIFMGGLSFGFGFLGLARHLQQSRSVATMAGFGAIAGIIYAAFVALLLGGLSKEMLSLLLPAGVAGSIAGALWTILFERYRDA